MAEDAPTKGRLALERQHEEEVVSLQRDPLKNWHRLKEKKLRKIYHAQAIKDRSYEIHAQLEEVTQ